MSDKRSIGIFDSGIGGLTVVKELTKQLPNEDIVYFGDTARVPYGTKSTDTVIRFSIENMLFLLRHNVKLIIVACNTSSSVALGVLKRNFKVPIMGVIEPGAKDAVLSTRNNRIGVIGTSATVRSRAYEKKIISRRAAAKVFSASCPLFVPLVEEGWTGGKITMDIANKYLAPLKGKGIDTLILGCTHYPLLYSGIKKIMGKRVAIVDSAISTAKAAKEFLSKNGIISGKHSKGVQKFYVSDEPEKFKRAGGHFLGRKLSYVRKVTNGI